MKINSSRMPVQRAIPYRLYGNTVSVRKQAMSELSGKSGEVPFPGVPPDEVQIR